MEGKHSSQHVVEPREGDSCRATLPPSHPSDQGRPLSSQSQTAQGEAAGPALGWLGRHHSVHPRPSPAFPQGLAVAVRPLLHLTSDVSEGGGRVPNSRLVKFSQNLGLGKKKKKPHLGNPIVFPPAEASPRLQPQPARGHRGQLLPHAGKGFHRQHGISPLRKQTDELLLLHIFERLPRRKGNRMTPKAGPLKI